MSVVVAVTDRFSRVLTTFTLLFIVSFYFIVTDYDENVQIFGSWIILIVVALLLGYGFSSSSPGKTTITDTLYYANYVGFILLFIFSLVTRNYIFIISSIIYILVSLYTSFI